MTERKKNWITIAFSALTPSIIAGIVYLIWALGLNSQAQASQEKINDQVRKEIEQLRIGKADNETVLRIYQDNKDAHKRLEEGQEMILKELLKKK